MRKGFSLTEMMVVIIILPFVFFVLDGLFVTLLREIPRSCRVAEQGSSLLSLLEQMHRDVEQAKSLPAEFAGRTAGEKLLLVELPDGVVGYQIEDDGVTRSEFTDAVRSVPVRADSNERLTASLQAERIWSMPGGKIEWQVRREDGRRYAVEIKTHMEFKFHGRTEEKMARTYLFYEGVLR